MYMSGILRMNEVDVTMINGSCMVYVLEHMSWFFIFNNISSRDTG